jgi:uncharacterized protein (DUF2267 family)
MTMTGLEVFDTTIHKTNVWLKEVMEGIHRGDRRKAYDALRATLHALRDRLTVEEVAQLGAQLPMLIRGIYYEGWDPTNKPLKLRGRTEFLRLIDQKFKADDALNAELIARAVFAVLARRVTEGEIEDIKHMLPGEIRDLWP